MIRSIRTSAVPVLALVLGALAPTALRAQQQQHDGGADHDSIPQPLHVVTHHSARIGGTTVDYDATLGSILIRDDDDQPIGEIYYTAYRRTDLGDQDASHRPLTFAYNGGPGSASLWLHIGALGPKRVLTGDTAHVPPPPYQLTDNQYSILDVTDLVMIDPVGTGLSHTVGNGKGTQFWGIDEDARSLAQFITRYLSQNDRWNSPRYLLGESYGTTRSAALAKVLQNDNVDLNGVILLSSVLDFQTINFNPGNELPYIFYLPSYAATAWYHQVLPDRPAELEPFLDQVEKFAIGEYAHALLEGPDLPAAERSDVLDKLVQYTGLDRTYLERANLRVEYGAFMKELMREHNLVVGRLDSRFTGASEDWLGEDADYDPQSAAVSSAFASAFNRYLRDDLGYKGSRQYVVSGNVQPWNWQQGRVYWPGHTDVADDLADAMRRNPTLKVQLNSGYYDLATPYFASDYTMKHMQLPPRILANVETEKYKAGHMMYLYEPALARLKQNVAAFIQRTSSAATRAASMAGDAGF